MLKGIIVKIGKRFMGFKSMLQYNLLFKGFSTQPSFLWKVYKFAKPAKKQASAH